MRSYRQDSSEAGPREGQLLCLWTKAAQSSSHPSASAIWHFGMYRAADTGRSSDCACTFTGSWFMTPHTHTSFQSSRTSEHIFRPYTTQSCLWSPTDSHSEGFNPFPISHTGVRAWRPPWPSDPSRGCPRRPRGPLVMPLVVGGFAPPRSCPPLTYTPGRVWWHCRVLMRTVESMD